MQSPDVLQGWKEKKKRGEPGGVRVAFIPQTSIPPIQVRYRMYVGFRRSVHKSVIGRNRKGPIGSLAKEEHFAHIPIQVRSERSQVRTVGDLKRYGRCGWRAYSELGDRESPAYGT